MAFCFTDQDCVLQSEGSSDSQVVCLTPLQVSGTDFPGRFTLFLTVHVCIHIAQHE